MKLFILQLLFTFLAFAQEDDDSAEAEVALVDEAETTTTAKPERRIHLETFTYTEADYDTKLAAFRQGFDYSAEILDDMLPEYNETMLIAEDKRRNWRLYQYIPDYENQARQRFRQAYVQRKAMLRRDARPELVKQCPKKCAEYLAANFTAPDVGNSSEAAELLMESGMAEFSANFISLGLEEMYEIQDENCNQWEAKWQCLYGCFQDLSLIHGMERQLTGDEHLSVNIECPDNRFLINLPCISANIKEVTQGCSKRDAAINETAEIIEDLKADGMYKTGFAKVLRVSDRYLAAMEVRDKQRNMCTVYHSYLDCAIRGLKKPCNERAASYFHTSVVANFLERLLPERLSVEKIIGTIPASCEYLVQKREYRLLPIESHSSD